MEVTEGKSSLSVTQKWVRGPGTAEPAVAPSPPAPGPETVQRRVQDLRHGGAAVEAAWMLCLSARGCPFMPAPPPSHP